MSRNQKQGMWVILGAGLLLAMATGCREERSSVTVPPGTSVVVSLATPLNTATAEQGQELSAETSEPIMVKGRAVVEPGAVVRGYVRDVQKAGAISHPAEITLDFDELVSDDGTVYTFDAAPITLTAESDARSDVQRVAGATVAGAIIGGIARGAKGASVGALIGAGAGGTWAVATKGDQIVLEPGQLFRIQIVTGTALPLQASS